MSLASPLLIGDASTIRGDARSAEGRLGDEELVAGDRAFVVGDTVVALRNDRRLQLINGTLATVTGLNAKDQSLTITTATGETRIVPSNYLADGHLDHAYALSVHKGQGMTCDVALLLGDDRLYLEAGYTGLSRGRTKNRLYVVASEPDFESHGTAFERDHDIVRSLRRSAAQDSASVIAERSRRSVGFGIEL